MSEPIVVVEAKVVVQINQRDSEVIRFEQLKNESVDWSNFDFSVERRRSLRARFVYGFIFLLTNLLAWMVRDYGYMVFPELHFLKACGIGGQECFGTMGVLRVSLGCFVSFLYNITECIHLF
ncbi:hypothetical protein GIB67_005815 [Kingdonia uniflora]|uniref:Uncharacterized protein n=1 Tax=Kingdonia uniflora TaxID=39325 RepID=A0A7J7MPT6_9MAGN|nr:hypothetical protein GIB67_005815 [Kingdonia uniflora]